MEHSSSHQQIQVPTIATDSFHQQTIEATTELKTAKIMSTKIAPTVTKSTTPTTSAENANPTNNTDPAKLFDHNKETTTPAEDILRTTVTDQLEDPSTIIHKTAETTTTTTTTTTTMANEMAVPHTKTIRETPTPATAVQTTTH